MTLSSEQRDTEFVWLIERGQDMKQVPTVWWTGADENGYSSQGHWTTDANRARKYPDRESAQAEIDARSHPLPSNDFAVFGKAVEHGFMTLSSEQRDRKWEWERWTIDPIARNDPRPCSWCGSVRSIREHRTSEHGADLIRCTHPESCWRRRLPR